MNGKHSEAAPVASRHPILRIDGLTKVYPGVIANDAVSLDFFAGEVHAILGENGAGKSTLVKMLYGIEQPDAGRVVWQQRDVKIPAPRRAQEMGLAMVQQHMCLVPSFTVLENVRLQEVRGDEQGEALEETSLENRLTSLCQSFGLEIDLHARVADLPLGTRQVIDILKALVNRCSLLILDEPTAVLTAGEVERLFQLIRQLRGTGCAIILIAHKISEVLDISDRISVLRDGRMVGTVMRGQADRGSLAHMMVGREVADSVDLPDVSVDAAEPRLVAREVREPGEGLELLAGLTFSVYPGEIFGVAGVDGNGQRRLFDVLAGKNTGFEGDLTVLGNDPRAMPRKAYLRAPVSLVPEDRHHLGLILDMSVAENAILQSCGSEHLSWRGHLYKPARWRYEAERLIKTFGVKCGSPDHRISSLSGGNQQKVLLARELAREPDLLVLSNPTRGLDISAIEAIRDLILAERGRGCAILLISSDLDEVLAMSDRIGVMHAGRFAAILDRADFDVRRIGLLMGGEEAA